MSEEELTCPSCRVEIDPISLDRCTGCGLPFSPELVALLTSTYVSSVADRNLKTIDSGVKPDDRTVAVAADENETRDADTIPVAMIDPYAAHFVGRNFRERWARSLPARIFLRSGVGLSIWSMVVSVLGGLALVPAFFGLLFCLVSIFGDERWWALAGIVFSLGSMVVVIATLGLAT